MEKYTKYKIHQLIIRLFILIVADLLSRYYGTFTMLTFIGLYLTFEINVLDKYGN